MYIIVSIGRAATRLIFVETWKAKHYVKTSELGALVVQSFAETVDSDTSITPFEISASRVYDGNCRMKQQCTRMTYE